MKILTYIINVSTAIFIALTIIFIGQTAYYQYQVRKIKAFAAKADAENLRWKALSEEEQIAEEINECRQNPFGTLEGTYTVTISEAHGKNPKTYEGCYDVKAVSNYCTFKQNIDGTILTKEFPRCEYSIPNADKCTIQSPILLTKAEEEELFGALSKLSQDMQVSNGGAKTYIQSFEEINGPSRVQQWPMPEQEYESFTNFKGIRVGMNHIQAFEHVQKNIYDPQHGKPKGLYLTAAWPTHPDRHTGEIPIKWALQYNTTEEGNIYRQKGVWVYFDSKGDITSIEGPK